MKPSPGNTPSSAQPPHDPNTPNSEGAERIDPNWSWHHCMLLQLRERLLQMATPQGNAALRPPAIRALEAEKIANRADADVLWTELARENDRLFEVDAALNRLREGRYGFCELTGAPISEDRLRAIPWTRYSVTSAKFIEGRSTMPGGL